ncbi:hypothetical protein ATCVCan0610SP_631L [Acanthocystis turfacea Chlorella virus Can0610SP]|nr:hypothetical protein ATCVCan0610SP_631L [Acanthocystis turfacea Chlorella virus Can0610SP]
MSMSLKQEISIAKCERIMIYPYVRLDEGNKSFNEFAKECSDYWGGSQEDWVQRNKHLIGFFSSKKKRLERGSKFKFPQCLVDDAHDRFFETVGIPSKRTKIPSPSSVVDNTSSPDSTTDTDPTHHMFSLSAVSNSAVSNTPSPDSMDTDRSPGMYTIEIEMK